MAANFWESTHSKWLISKQRLNDIQPEDRSRGLIEDQVQQLRIFFTQSIFDLARTSKIRQRVAATAVVYFRRFYLRNSFCQFDPFLVAPGCLYLACKAEESILGARHLVAYMKKVRPSWAYEMKHLLDIEMVILEELDLNLVVFSPYHALVKFLQADAMLADLGQNAWATLNDLYRTDLSLVYPPHLLALGCLYLASIICSREIGLWLENLNVDLNQVYDITMEMLRLYEKYRVPISQEECNRLLSSLRAPQ